VVASRLFTTVGFAASEKTSTPKITDVATRRKIDGSVRGSAYHGMNARFHHVEGVDDGSRTPAVDPIAKPINAPRREFHQRTSRLFGTKSQEP
jgi:hypothetical protein